MKTQKFIVEITSVAGFSIDKAKLHKLIWDNLESSFYLNVYQEE